MRHSLRKSSSLINISFTDNDWINSLSGRNFEYCIENNTVFIDLSENIKVRNKGSNEYYDVLHLWDKRETLKTIQILEKQIYGNLIKRIPNHEIANIEMNIENGKIIRIRAEIEYKDDNEEFCINKTN